MQKNTSKKFLSVLTAVLLVLELLAVSLSGIVILADEADEELSVYNAATVIQEQIDAYEQNGQETFYPEDAVWTMQTAPVPEDVSGGYVTENTVWTTPTLKMHPDGYPFVDSSRKQNEYLKPYMYYSNDLGETAGNRAVKGGILSDGEYAGITAGTNWETLSSLAFIAPKDGTVTLSDPEGGNIQPWLYHSDVGVNSTLWTLMDEGDKVGVAIYRNNEKLWPADADYAELSKENPTLAFPTVEGVDVTAGDVLRIVIIPLTEARGYFEMNPQVVYEEEPGGEEPGGEEPGGEEPGGEEPGDEEPGDEEPGDEEPGGVYLDEYNSTEYIREQVNAYQANDPPVEMFYPASALWVMETTSVVKDGSTGLYRIADFSDWTIRTVKMHPNGNPFVNSTERNNAVYLKPYMFYDPTLQDIPLTQRGKWIYGGIMSDGTYTGITSGYNWETASSLTFIVPKSGTVTLCDPEGGDIQPWMYHAYSTQAVTDLGTLYKEGEITDESAGVAIYKNEEKIWPQDEDYYTLSRNGGRTVPFPELQNIEVETGDKLRIVFIPLSENRGYFELNASVLYTAFSEELPSYSSVESIQAAVENGGFPEEPVWFYSGKRLVLDDETGEYRAAGEWLYPELRPGDTDSNEINNALADRLVMLDIPSSNAGLAVKDGKIYTYVGYGKNGLAAALTFAAPYTGDIVISDPFGVGIRSAGTGAPWYTMHDDAKKVGIAIYKNEEKIWPKTGEYRVLTGDDWTDGKKTNSGETGIAFPDLGTISVEKGDEVRIAIIPLTLNWGYFTLAPNVRYTSLAEEQPEQVKLPMYSAYDSVAQGLSDGNLENSVWQFDAAAVFPDKKGLSSIQGNWGNFPLTKGSISDASIAEKVPDWLYYAGTNIAITAYRNNLILSTGASGVDYAVAATFVAPKTGTVRLYDREIGLIGSAGIGAPFYSLNETDKIAGIAIYKNEEKIWPADSDYYTLAGTYDRKYQTYDTSNESEVLFPTIEDIPVVEGDRLRICVIPVKNRWLFVRTSPVVEYTDVDEDAVVPATEPEPEPVATYDAALMLKEAIEKEDLSNSAWTLQAIRNVNSDIVGEDMIPGDLFGTNLGLLFKKMTFGSSSFPFDWFNVPDSSLAITVNDDNRLLIPVGSYTGSGYTVWPAVTFQVPSTGVIRLHAPDLSAGFAAAPASAPYYMLQQDIDPDEGGNYPFIIYRNSTQIWPTESEDNTLTLSQRTIPFPDLTLQVYEGDSIRIVVSGGTWGFVTLRPVVDYLEFNQRERPAGDSPDWTFTNGDASNDIVWEDFDTPVPSPEIPAELPIKKENSMKLWIAIAVGGTGVVIAAATVTSVIFVRRRKKLTNQ